MNSGARIRAIWASCTGRLRRHQTLFRFSSASVLYSVTTMAAGIVILLWLDPEDVGLWQSLLLIQAYSLVVQAGVLNGLNRELPFSLGAGDDSQALELAATAQSVALGGAALLVLGGGLALLLPGDLDARCGAAIVFLCTASLIYRNYLGVTYRAERAFETLARIRVAEAAMEVVTLPLVYYFHFAGLAGRYLLTSLVDLVINHAYRPIRAPMRFSWRHLVVLLKVGVPLFACAYLYEVSHTFPRVILLSEGGVELVGLFAPASAVVGLMQMLPTSLAQYIYPQMSFTYGKTGDPRSVWPMAWKTAVGIIVISLPMLLVAELVVPWLVVWWFPKYVASVPAVRWALFTGVFLGASISVNAMFTLKAWQWVGTYAVIRALTAFLIPWCLFHAMANPLEGVAAGYMLSQALSFAVAMYCIYRATHRSAAVPQAAPAA